MKIDMTKAVDLDTPGRPLEGIAQGKVELDSEQLEALNWEGNCLVTGPPGTGKTEVFNALGERHIGSAAFLPFTRAARAELQARLPSNQINIEGEFYKYPDHNIVVATINSFCQGYLEKWPGSYSSQVSEFLKLKNKPTYDLVGVDEVQDLKPSHFEVIKAVKNGRLFAGGDPYQTIFTFGDAMGYKIFEELKEVGCKEVLLHNDYRSGSDIVELLNHLYPREIVAKGPKTYGRDAVFTRGHEELELISHKFLKEGIPHIMRDRKGRDRRILGGGNLYLMVAHACKGLGFDRVFQFDWYISSRPDTNWEEEYNLLYVSVARASKEWYLVDSSNRTFCSPYLMGSNYNQLVMAEVLKLL